MALTCPVDLDVATLQNEIQTLYGRVASAPDAEFHFHRGAEYAASRMSTFARATPRVYRSTIRPSTS